MPTIHFLNVSEGDCNIIQHGSNRITVIDVCNAYNDVDTPEEIAARESETRKAKLRNTNVPSGKVNYGRKLHPENPIKYLKEKVKTNQIFRFIISHPDMDHIDGIKDLYTEFKPTNTWDTNNTKEINLEGSFAGFNKEDWEFYKSLRAGDIKNTTRLTYTDDTKPCDFWNKDGIEILSPSKELIQRANETGDFNDLSFVLLYTVGNRSGRNWRILFTGDSDNHSWEHILRKYSQRIADVDVLLAPHHGRDSGRSYEFLKTLKPKVTLFGNADSNHLAYGCYPEIRITNNQAGNVVIDVSNEAMTFYVQHFEFARDFTSRDNKNPHPFQRYKGAEPFNYKFLAYKIGSLRDG